MSTAAEVVVFAGPSLPPARRAQHPGIVWRGPAVAGDALALLDTPPRAVALIDGLFDQAPAIRHKELLMLMARGVHLVGAASMGALRAAELAAFGMVGVGAIYRAYQSGRLTRDDEVALMHGPEELDWAPLTVPLVEVRATLVAAVRRRVLDAHAARAVLRSADAIFYQHRTWASVAARLRAGGGVAEVEIQALEAHLPIGRVELKRRDAGDCVDAALRLARTPAPIRPAPPQTPFTAALATWAARRTHPSV